MLYGKTGLIILKFWKPNAADKTFKLLINGQLFETSVKDQFDLLLEGLGMQSKRQHKNK